MCFWLFCIVFLAQGAFVSIVDGQAVPNPRPPTPTAPSLPGLDDLPEVKLGGTITVPTETPKNPEYEVMRVLSPGVFDVKADSFLIRFRAWGVGFPKRNQPGFREALRFTEEQLLGMKVNLELKREFDVDNLKLVDVRQVGGHTTFCRAAILSGHGWHLDKETGRYGPFSLAQTGHTLF